jgi:hypothetical protein
MIEERELLLMPNRDSVAAVFGHSYKADYFNWRDGDLLLFIASAFSDSEIEDALKADGKIVTGYAFEYYGFISIKRIGLKGWCACPWNGVGLALSREVAEAVHKASYTAFKRDIELCYLERERKMRELGII